VPRDEWGARTPRRINKRDPLSPFLLVHHGGIANYSSTPEGSAAIIRSYQDLHMDQRGWDDIGYSFLIGEDGRVYEGRGWDRVGAHAPQYNHVSIGVCFLGDFSGRRKEKYKLIVCKILIYIVYNKTVLMEA
jgi:peptidoglycan recognition protein